MLKYDFENSKEKMIKYIEEKGVSNYLIKSFCEGGYGDIIVGNEITEFIQKNSIDYLNKHILVRKIQSPLQPSILLWNGNEIKYLEETVSEYSFFQNLIYKEDAEG